MSSNGAGIWTGSAERPMGGPSGRAVRVLVVDDEPQIGNTLRLLLQPECDVTVLTSARVALDQLRRGVRFDLILCDLMMPDLSGVSFHDELLAIDPALAEGIVFMTGGAYTKTSHEFLEQTSNRCVEKPFDMAELRELIAERARSPVV